MNLQKKLLVPSILTVGRSAALFLISFGVSGIAFGLTSFPDPQATYLLSNAFLKDDQVLTAGPNSALQMAKRDYSPKQLWKFKATSNGYYRITNADLGEGMSIDSDTKAPNIRPTGNYSGQLWKLTPSGSGYYRLSNMYQTDAKSLDTYGSTPHAPFLGGSGNYSGQFWKLTAYEIKTNTIKIVPLPTVNLQTSSDQTIALDSEQTLIKNNLSTIVTPSMVAGTLSKVSTPQVQRPLPKKWVQGPSMPIRPIFRSSIVIAGVDGQPITRQAQDLAKSQALCGGPNQPACGFKPATFEAAATGTCPDGSFFDIGSWQCWSCPTGFTRNANAVTSDRACEKLKANWTPGAIRHAADTAKATYLGPLCPDGSFFDPIRGGECYSCPQGYNRSAAHINAGNACFIPAGEVLTKAVTVKKTFWPHECASGTFHDGWNGGACWKCPSGYRRTGNHINGSNACVITNKETWAKAVLVKRAKCGDGEIFDMRIQGTQNAATGGGCWTCKSPMERTADSIDSASACATPKGFEFSKAEFKAALTCPQGQIFDFIGLTAQDIATREQFKELANKPKEVKSGTCWSCPPGYERQLGSVKGNSACHANGIEWYTAPYSEPGLFGLKGAKEVLLEAINEPRSPYRELVVQQALNMTGETRDQFVLHPETSAAATGLVFTRLLNAIMDPNNTTANQKQLVNSFKEYVIARRVYVAQDALTQYDTWQAGRAYRATLQGDRSMMGSAGLAGVLIGLAEKEPDFAVSAALGMITGEAAGFAAGMIPKVGDVASFLLTVPGAFVDTAHPSETVANLSVSAVQNLAGVGLSKAYELVLKTALLDYAKIYAVFSATPAKQIGTTAFWGNFAANMGPQIIITAGITLVSMMVDKAIATANVRPGLEAVLATAKSDPQLARLVQTPAGMAELVRLWTYSIGGRAPLSGSDRATFEAAVTKAGLSYGAAPQGANYAP